MENTQVVFEKDDYSKLDQIEILEQHVDDDSALISLYYGEDVQEEDASKLAEEVEALYPEIDIDLHLGGQPIYYYVMSVE